MFFSKNNNKDFQQKNNPQHVAIIMDGNGRWAKKRGLPRIAGHRAGVETLKEIIQISSDLGMKVLTLYAFSTENWQRPKVEVNALMNLLVEYLNREIEELHKNNVKIVTIGNIYKLPIRPRNAVLKAIEFTKNNTGLIVNVALNYGGRDELVYAFKKLMLDVQKGIVPSDTIDEQMIKNYLYTKDLPDPDLLIRPSGELRISNFLLWQLAYTEFWFTDILWPDFKKEHLLEAIDSYKNRERRYGGLSKSNKKEE